MSEEQKLELSLTVREINTILAALAELPAKTSMSVIQDIRRQAEAQLIEEGA